MRITTISVAISNQKANELTVLEEMVVMLSENIEFKLQFGMIN